jgi:hypothetical protein
MDEKCKFCTDGFILTKKESIYGYNGHKIMVSQATPCPECMQISNHQNNPLNKNNLGNEKKKEFQGNRNGFKRPN